MKTSSNTVIANAVKQSVFFLLMVCMLAINIIASQAQERKLVKAHMTLYSKTVHDILVEKVGNDSEMINFEVMKRVLLDDMKLKRALQTTDENFSSESQWMYFGPSMIDVTEDADDLGQATDTIYAKCMRPGQPVYEQIQSLKSKYNMSNINPYVITSMLNYTTRGEDIMIRGASANFGQTYCGGFLSMVMPAEGDHTLTPLSGEKFTDPMGKVHKIATLGGLVGDQAIFSFAVKGKTWPIQYYNNGELDTAWAPIGDEEHDFLHPTTGCQWDQVFNNADEVNLPFQTRPDTLTAEQDNVGRIKVFPAWNDENVGKILYVAGDRIAHKKGLYEDENYCGIDQLDTDRDPLFVAYAVEISGQVVPMFAADHITIIFVPKLEYPTIDQSTVPSHVDSGQEFTIRLKGDTDLMTSWIPEFKVSGVDHEILHSDQESVTIRALSGGQMTITLHHNSLLVLEDETVSLSVTSVEQYLREDSEIKYYPNPTVDLVTVSFETTQYHNGIFRIVDVMGFTRKEIHAAGTEFRVSLPMETLPSGMYFLQINLDGQTTVRKVIKE